MYHAVYLSRSVLNVFVWDSFTLFVDTLLLLKEEKTQLHAKDHKDPSSQSLFKLKDYWNFKVENFMCLKDLQKQNLDDISF